MDDGEEKEKKGREKKMSEPDYYRLMLHQKT